MCTFLLSLASFFPQFLIIHAISKFSFAKSHWHLSFDKEKYAKTIGFTRRWDSILSNGIRKQAGIDRLEGKA